MGLVNTFVVELSVVEICKFAVLLETEQLKSHPPPSSFAILHSARLCTSMLWTPLQGGLHLSSKATGLNALHFCFRDQCACSQYCCSRADTIITYLAYRNLRVHY